MEELGDFLRSRRSRLSPQDAGVRAYGERRRVPGLRREELAQLAGVSVAYYTRLEQGLPRTPRTGCSPPSPGRCGWTPTRPPT